MEAGGLEGTGRFRGSVRRGLAADTGLLLLLLLGSQEEAWSGVASGCLEDIAKANIKISVNNMRDESKVGQDYICTFVGSTKVEPTCFA